MNAVRSLYAARFLRLGLCLAFLALRTALFPCVYAVVSAQTGTEGLVYEKASLYHNRAHSDQSLLSSAAVQTASGAPENSDTGRVRHGTDYDAAALRPFWAAQPVGLSSFPPPDDPLPVAVFFLVAALLITVTVCLLHGFAKSERLLRQLLRRSKITDVIKVSLLRKRAVSVTRFALFNAEAKKTVSLDELTYCLQKDVLASYPQRYKNKKSAAGFEEQLTVVKNNEHEYYTLYCLMLSRFRCLLSLTDVTEETIRQKKLEKLAGTNPLTGLYDQAHFKAAVAGQLAARSRMKAVLLIFNLRSFSEIIDRYSYTVGDDVLLGVSEQLKLFPHGSKILGHLGGDTFALLLCDLPASFSLSAVYDWSLSYEISQTKMTLPFYGGLSLYPSDADNAEDLFNYAQFAAELARHDHNARVLPFNRGAYSNHLRYQEALEAYPDVVQRELLYPVYQPVISLQTGGLFGYEAFTRCSHSAFPEIEQLIVVSRNVQDIDRLTVLLLKKSYDAFPFHRYPQQKLFIKVGLGFVTDADAFWNKYAAVLDNINFNHLVIEVTERYEIVNYKEHDALLSRIKQQGGTISLDDYGEGYSNEASLIRIRPAIVKLASTLVSGVDQDEYKRSFILKFIQFAWKTDTLVLAEGVETQKELDTLKKLKVDLVQGYLLGKPETIQ